MAVLPECLMLNLDSGSRLQALLGETHPILWLTTWISVHSFRRFSALLATQNHHLMNLDVATVIHSGSTGTLRNLGFPTEYHAQLWVTKILHGLLRDRCHREQNVKGGDYF